MKVKVIIYCDLISFIYSTILLYKCLLLFSKFSAPS